MRNSSFNNKPCRPTLGRAFVIAHIAILLLIAVLFLWVAISANTIASPTPSNKGDIVLPPNVSAIEVNNKDWRYKGNKADRCFHLVRADDGQPDYVLGECR